MTLLRSIIGFSLLVTWTQARLPLWEVYSWKTLDFAYPNLTSRDLAVASEDWIPEHSVLMGVEAWKDRLFFAIPRWKRGIPITVASLKRDPEKGEHSPPLEPFPDWTWHNPGDCDTITNPFRIRVDSCGRLWVVDAGSIHSLEDKPESICPPQLFVFDLETDKLVHRYEIPKEQLREKSLLVNAAVDIRDGKCDEAFAYIADAGSYALIVYDLKNGESWRVEHPYMYPYPLSGEYVSGGSSFTLMDGILGLALSPIFNNNRLLFFHNMASVRMSWVPTSVLRDKQLASSSSKAFGVSPPTVSQSIGITSDPDGVLFFGLMSRSSVACWNTRDRFLPQELYRDEDKLVWPNDVLVDYNRTLWVVSNKLTKFITGGMDFTDTNFRLLRTNAREAIRGTTCDLTI